MSPKMAFCTLLRTLKLLQSEPNGCLLSRTYYQRGSCRLLASNTFQSLQSTCAHYRTSLYQWHHRLWWFLVHRGSNSLSTFGSVPDQQCPISTAWCCGSHVWCFSASTFECVWVIFILPYKVNTDCIEKVLIEWVVGIPQKQTTFTDTARANQKHLEQKIAVTTIHLAV